MERLGHTLGLYGVESEQLRKIVRTGNSVAVTLDPLLVQEVLKGAKPGTQVRVGRQGDAIVIRRA